MKDVFWLGPLGALVMVGTFFANGGHEGLSAWEWVSVALAGAAVLLVAGRRSAPGVTVLAVGAAVGTYFACGFGDGPIYLPLFVAAYLGARAVAVNRWLPWFVAGVALVIIGMIVRAATGGSGWWQLLVQSVGVAAVASAAATSASLVRSRAQTVAERHARLATEEQLLMAQELHDGVGHGLAVVAMQAGVALHVLDRDPAAVRRALEAIRDTSRESLEALRDELSRLSGAAPRTPLRGLGDLGVLAERIRAAGIGVTVTGGELDAPAPVAHAAYLIVQEGLTNVLRHSNARTVSVQVLSDAAGLVVRIADDGTGGRVHDEGMGIRGMRRRAEEHGGSVTAGPVASGFIVTARLPIPVAQSRAGTAR